MEKIKVKDHLNLYRDPKSNAIINSNMKEYQNYMTMKKAKEEESLKIQNIEDDLNLLKNDITEIKNLLRNLINGS
jgi:hypothetical protein